MADKFKCVECGENDVDDEDDVCEQCWQEGENGEEWRMILVYKPRKFVAQWLKFHKLNVIDIKELFYLHKKGK